MKEKFFSKKACEKAFKLCFVFICLVLSCSNASAGGRLHNLTSRANLKIDTLAEEKVDYLAQIYFSGKNKQELSGYILAIIQQMEGKQSSISVARQYTFLNGIKDKVEGAKNACEVIEMVANGIYAIDAAKAIEMEIPKPKSDSKATLNASDALSSLNSLNNTARDAAITNWYLSGGKSIAGLNETSKLSQKLDLANKGMQGFEQGTTLFKKLKIGGGDNSCKSVPVKVIAIGEHAAPTTSSNSTLANNQNTNSGSVTTVTQNSTTTNSASGIKIIIKNITYNQFSSVALALEKTSGISSVNSDEFGSNAGTLLVACSMRTKEIVDRIIQSNPNISFEIENTSSNAANLVVKNKK